MIDKYGYKWETKLNDKRIKSKFLLLPFKDEAGWHWMRRVNMVQRYELTITPFPVFVQTFDWHNLYIATIEDYIKI